MLSSSLVIFIALIAVCCVVESKTNLNDFSVAYLAGSDHPQLVNAETVFQATPTAIQLADIYTRISGISPILAEGMFIEGIVDVQLFC